MRTVRMERPYVECVTSEQRHSLSIREQLQSCAFVVGNCVAQMAQGPHRFALEVSSQKCKKRTTRSQRFERRSHGKLRESGEMRSWMRRG